MFEADDIQGNEAGLKDGAAQRRTYPRTAAPLFFLTALQVFMSPATRFFATICDFFWATICRTRTRGAVLLTGGRRLAKSHKSISCSRLRRYAQNFSTGLRSGLLGCKFVWRRAEVRPILVSVPMEFCILHPNDKQDYDNCKLRAVQRACETNLSVARRDLRFESHMCCNMTMV